MELIFEKFDKVIDNEVGTIRTRPENYYVASVYADGTIIFEGIETQTKDINKDDVLRWAGKNNISPFFQGW